MVLSAKRIRQLYAWHRWTGLASGLFIFVITLTGAVAVFKHEIDRLLTPALRVAPSDSGQRASLDDILRVVRERYAGAVIEYVNLGGDPQTAHTIHLNYQKQNWQVFAHPYTGQLTGARTGETASNVIRQLHVRFYYFGFWGRVVVGAFGLLLLISTLTGLLIYGRFMKGVFARGLRFWQIREGQGWRAWASDWHKLIGLLALLFNLIIAITGAVLGLENLSRYSPAVDAALHPRPVKTPPPLSLDRMLGLDEALARAREALPGFSPTNVQLPQPQKNHFVVHGNVAGRFERSGASFVIVETSAGGILQVHNAAAARPVTQIYNLSEPLHFGDFAGVPLKIIYLLFGLASSFLSLTGYIIWALKRKKYRSTVSASRERRAKMKEAAVRQVSPT